MDVVAIDNLSKGTLANVNKKASFHELDIRNYDGILRLSQDVDLFFHCAALLPVVLPPFEDTVEHEEVNVVGTLQCLRAIMGKNISKFMFVSSCAIYGDAEQLPTPEDARPNLLTRPYSIQKYAGEQHSLLLGKRHDIPVLALRYFAVYGPRSSNPTRPNNVYSPVIGIFLKQHKSGQALTVTGDGNQSRDFIHVHDVARMTIEAALSGQILDVYNVCSGTTISVLDLARKISPNITFVPRHHGEAEIVWGDSSKIHRELGLSPRITIDEGLEQVAASLL
jgi:UDP-glucose 4-epimerase